MNSMTSQKYAEFAQNIPDRDNWVLVRSDIHSGSLIYQHGETSQRICVPNIWYNQPVAWRVDSMRFYAQRAAECAERTRASVTPWAETEARKADRRQRDLLALAKEMEATRKVLA